MCKRIALLCLLLVAMPAAAYECRTPVPLASIVRDADVVFIGRAASARNIGSSFTELGFERSEVRFTTDIIYKGLPTDSTSADVDTEAIYKYTFEEGEYYLVFGYHLYGKDRISMVGCPRVNKLTRTTLAALNRVATPVAQTGALPNNLLPLPASQDLKEVPNE